MRYFNFIRFNCKINILCNLQQLNFKKFTPNKCNNGCSKSNYTILFTIDKPRSQFRRFAKIELV